jgi:hypothetical protein
MNENSKTICFVGVAILVLGAAFATRARAPVVNVSDLVGKTLFDKLDDPLKAKRIEIDTIDESTAQTRKLEVAQVNGVWSLPSHENYLADAKDQVASAVTALMDMKVLEPVGTKGAQEHELYGVIEPKLDDENQIGQRGIGKLVVVSDEAGKPLARVIIGKEDKSMKKDEFGSSPSQLRFVRIPGRDQVYRVQLKADKFSPKFEDWIETDLLKLQPWDITEVKLSDYSLVDTVYPTGERGKGLQRRADIDLTFDDKTSKWELKDMIEHKGRSDNQGKLGEDEELNSVKLNDMKNALGALKIINVARKPAQLGTDLRAGKEAFDDVSVLRNLAHRGFYPQPVVGEDRFEIFSDEGEAVVRMKDGIEYVLRFGAVEGIDTGSDEENKADTEKKADTADENSEKKDKGGLSRYIMVMARFNQDLLTKPELEPLPESKKSTDKDKSADAKKSDAKSADTKGKDAKGAAAKADAKSADAKKDDTKKDASKSTDAKAGDAKSEGTKSASKSGDAKSNQAGASDKDSGEDQEALDAERDRVEAANKRKQDAFDEKVKAGEQKAKELNARFADWYYVVGEDTYRKIHLGKSDIIKKKLKDTKDTKDSAATTTPTNPFNLNALPSGKK